MYHYLNTTIEAYHTGGGCMCTKVTHIPSSIEILITDQDGCGFPEERDWLAGVYLPDSDYSEAYILEKSVVQDPTMLACTFPNNLKTGTVETINWLMNALVDKIDAKPQASIFLVAIASILSANQPNYQAHVIKSVMEIHNA